MKIARNPFSALAADDEAVDAAEVVEQGSCPESTVDCVAGPTVGKGKSPPT